MRADIEILELLLRTPHFMSVREIAQELKLTHDYVRARCNKIYWSVSERGVGILQRQVVPSGRGGRHVEYRHSHAREGGGVTEGV